MSLLNSLSTMLRDRHNFVDTLAAGYDAVKTVNIKGQRMKNLDRFNLNLIQSSFASIMIAAIERDARTEFETMLSNYRRMENELKKLGELKDTSSIIQRSK